MAETNHSSQFNSNRKGQNSLSNRGGSRPGTQNSLNPNYRIPQTHTEHSASSKTPTETKNPYRLLLVLALVVIGVLGCMLLKRDDSDQVRQPSVQTNPAQSQQTVSVQPQQTVPVQTTAQTVPVSQTEPPKETEPAPKLVRVPLISLWPERMPTDEKTCTVYIHLPADSELTKYVTGSQQFREPADAFGGTYGFSVHADGWYSVERKLTYRLNGEYTRFSGWVVCLSFASDPTGDKPIKIYIDDELVLNTRMSKNTEPIFFDFDVTGAEKLVIVYPQSGGSNDQATLCDAWLEAWETP